MLLMTLETIPFRLTGFELDWLSVGSETVHCVTAPVEAIASVRHGWITFSLNKHSFGSQPLTLISLYVLHGHHETSIPAATRIALLTATRAS